MSQLQDVLHKIKLAQLKIELEKKAGLWNAFKDGLAAAGTTAAVAGAGLAVQKGYNVLKERIEKPRAFKGMLGAAPGLKKMDQKAVQMTFNSLYAMNPNMAKDPLISGSFVERHVGRGEGLSSGAFIDPQTATLLQPKNKPQESPILRAFGTAGAMGVANAMKPEGPKHSPGMSEEEYGRQARMKEYESRLRNKNKGGKYPDLPKY